MALTLDIAGAQIDGARDYQEDAFLITNLIDKEGNPSALIIVADGMGGHAAGNVASNMAVQALNKHITANYPSDNYSKILEESINKANSSVAETIKETPALDGMGCTIVSVIMEKDRVWWGSVGDSHLYLLRNRELTKYNDDHSYGGFLDRMKAAGTPIEPEPGLSRNMLMSAITGGDIAEIDCSDSPLELQEGDKLIISTDGLDTLSSGKIIQYSEWADSAKEGTEALLNAVEEADMPKQDNTTVVFINVSGGAKAAAESPPLEVEEIEIDDEDITDPSGAALSATKPLTDISEEEEIREPVEEIPDDEGITPQELEEQTIEISKPPAPKSSKKGLMIGIAVGLVILIVVLGYVVISWIQSKAKSVSEEIEATSKEIAIDFGEAMQESIDEAQKQQGESAAIEEEVIDVDQEAEKIASEEHEKETDAIAPVKETKPETTKTTTPKPAVKEIITAKAKTGSFQDKLKSGGMTPEMVWIPGGSFEMGSPSSSGHATERPRHLVNIKSFAMSKYEITFTEYEKFAKATGRKHPNNLYMEKDTHPVIFVTWDDAYYYAKWISEQTGKKYRLPTESEWEYAASGGSSAPFWWGFEEQKNKAHCLGCGSIFDPRKPAKIGSFNPNQFSLYDTAGNVAEWVQDCWHDDYQNAPADGKVWEGGDCSLRIVRGGSYNSPQQSIRANKRDKLKSDSGYDIVGIRLARDPD